MAGGLGPAALAMERPFNIRLICSGVIFFMEDDNASNAEAEGGGGTRGGA